VTNLKLERLVSLRVMKYMLEEHHSSYGSRENKRLELHEQVEDLIEDLEQEIKKEKKK
jgi:Asp/Glu/hydantoin racemase